MFERPTMPAADTNRRDDPSRGGPQREPVSVLRLMMISLGSMHDSFYSICSDGGIQGILERRGWKMEPISDLMMSLVLGAGIVGGKELVSSIVKDAYKKLKAVILKHYPDIAISVLEQKPNSKDAQNVVERELAAANAGQNAAVLSAAQALLDVIRRDAPAAVTTMGIELDDVSAANVRLKDVVSAGGGVRMQRARIVGDIEITGVRAGSSLSTPKKPN
jgi:hypothetical protein